VDTLSKSPPLARVRSAADLAAYLFHFCGSLRLTVILMLYIAVACVFGTFFEGRHGTKAAQAAIYKSWWFDVGLGLMATNITCSTLRRWPFQRKHIGFIITHIGILTILFGAFLTHRYGIEGQVAIREGESESRMFQELNILTVSEKPGEIDESFPTDFEDRPWEHAPGTVFAAESLGATVTVEQYFPNAVFRESVSNDGTVENPAVRIALRGGQMAHNATSDDWLLSRDPDRRAFIRGRMTISLEEAESAAVVQSVVLALGWKADNDSPSLGVLRFSGSDLGIPPDFTVDVEKSEGQKIPLGESGAFIRVAKYYPAFIIEKNEAGNMRPTNKSELPLNPTIEYEVGRGDDVVDRRYEFLLHDFDIRPPQIALDVAWDAPDLLRASGASGPASGSKAFRLFSLPDGEIRYISTVSEVPASGVLKPGESVQLSESGISAQLISATRRARLVEDVENDGDEVKRPAVKVRVRRGGDEAVAWVPNQDVAPLRVGKAGPLYVGYGSRSIPLSFRLHLVDFKEEQYPRSAGVTPMSAAFSSRVILEDPERGVFREHVISMNNVLDWRGYRFFQSSFSRPPGAAPDSVPETSVFAVNKDPGKSTVYIGFVVLVSGIITLFYIQPAIRKRRAIRPAPKGPTSTPPAAPAFPVLAR
jgi:hypothetical protein